MGILLQRIAQAQQTSTLAYNPKAAIMQEYMIAIASQKGVKASALNIAEYVNRGHNGENCAFLYMQFNVLRQVNQALFSVFHYSLHYRIIVNCTNR